MRETTIRLRNIAFRTLTLLLLAGCATPSSTAQPTTTREAGAGPLPLATPLVDPSPLPGQLPSQTPPHSFTYQRGDGNRFLAGRGSLPEIEPLDIPLSGRPVWLIAAPLSEGSLWVVALEDGRLEAFLVTRQTADPVALNLAELPPGMPPTLVIQNGQPQILFPPFEDGSPYSHPIPLAGGSFDQAYLSRSGEVVFAGEDGSIRLAVSGLPDARLLSDGTGRILLLSDPTTTYAHGVLGDALEASGVTLLSVAPEPEVVERIPVLPPDVIEGTAPIWTDLTGDGVREIILTVSNPVEGARIIVLDEAGTLIARSPAIGTGFRWRHQLVVAPFGPNGELELASVLTPHIGGVVEFFKLAGSQLVGTGRLAGYSSHLLGSRNLDRGLAGDLDGDGRFELLVPDQAQQNLAAIQRESDGAIVDWILKLDGELSTNLTGVTWEDGSLGIGVGRLDNSLRLWLP